MNYFLLADPGGRAIYGLCLRPLSFWDSGFECLLEQERLFRVNIVSFQVVISATGQFLVQKSCSECGVSECDHEAIIIWWPWATRFCCVMKKILFDYVCFYITIGG